VELLWSGTTLEAWKNGVAMTSGALGSPNTSGMAAQVRAGIGVRTTNVGVFDSFCAMGGMAFWLGTTDRRTEVRALAASKGASIS
jgi:hypothetical protein